MHQVFSSCLTLGVDVWVRVSAGVDAKQRLQVDAAEVHAVDVCHHAGHHSLVKQRRTGYLEKYEDIFNIKTKCAAIPSAPQ